MSNLRIAVMISGAGTTLENLIRWQRDHELPVEFAHVISSRADATGLAHAREAGIPNSVVGRRECASPTAHADAIFAICRQEQVGLVVMGGYLDHLAIPPDFEHRVINIHPALIPAFCGRGYYGLRVHRAALEYGVKLSGCTVHFVDNEYDHGPIIAQRSCPVFAHDTPESLARRVWELECQLYPEVIGAIARGQVAVEGRRVEIRAIV